MSLYRYEVFDGKTGKKIAEGTAEECAKKMKISVGSFRTIRSRAYHGRGKYHIESSRERKQMEEMAEVWDRQFKWARENLIRVRYPCDGCMRRSICEFTDTYCPKWAAWFREAHEAAAAALGGQSR